MDLLFFPQNLTPLKITHQRGFEKSLDCGKLRGSVLNTIVSSVSRYVRSLGRLVGLIVNDELPGMTELREEAQG